MNQIVILLKKKVKIILLSIIIHVMLTHTVTIKYIRRGDAEHAAGVRFM